MIILTLIGALYLAFALWGFNTLLKMGCSKRSYKYWILSVSYGLFAMHFLAGAKYVALFGFLGLAVYAVLVFMNVKEEFKDVKLF